MSAKPTKLLIPGPVELDEEVLSTLGGPVTPHYGPWWVEAHRQMQVGLHTLFGTDGEIYPMVGSGTAGLDAAIGSLLAPGQRIAIVNNGFFGDRLQEVAEAHGLEVLSIEFPWGQAAKPEAVRQALSQAEPVHALTVVHVETSTGVLNPVPEIAAIGNELGIPVMVDAITSLGGVPMRMDQWGIDICISATQKALAAPAGLALVAVSQRGWKYMDAHPVGKRGWYLDLRTWRHYAEVWGEWHPQPVTMPSGTFYALNLRIQQILQEGLEHYMARHARAANRFRQGARKLGLELLVGDDEAAPVVTAVKMPAGVDAVQLLTILRTEHGLMAAAGLGSLRHQIIRIGHMGKAVSDEYVDAALEGLAGVLGLVKG